MRAADELEDIADAEREKEIGGIVDIYQRNIGNNAVLFDEVPGYPRGHRILANMLTSVRRINITLGPRPRCESHRFRALLAALYEGSAPHAAGDGEDRADHGECAHR